MLFSPPFKYLPIFLEFADRRALLGLHAVTRNDLHSTAAYGCNPGILVPKPLYNIVNKNYVDSDHLFSIAPMISGATRNIPKLHNIKSRRTLLAFSSS